MAREEPAVPCQLALGGLEDPKSVEKRMAQRGFLRDDPRGVAEPLPSRPLVGSRAEQPLSHSDPHQFATASLERASKRTRTRTRTRTRKEAMVCIYDTVEERATAV